MTSGNGPIGQISLMSDLLKPRLFALPHFVIVAVLAHDLIAPHKPRDLFEFDPLLAVLHQGHKELSTGRAKNASWLHFDIAQSKKALAVQYGAKRTDKYGPTEFLAKIVLERGDPRFVGKAQETLNSIARARAMPKA